jgi:Uma2 family endonuclease
MVTEPMPTVLTHAPETPRPLVPPRKRWTREQCAPLEASGLLEQERLELVDGELISKMGKNRPHVNALAMMYRRLMHIFGESFVNSEAPIDVSPEDNPTNEPEPDLIVLNREYTSFRAGNPQPQDLSLVVEIADSTLAFDLSTKARLYARAGIIEYWVLDVERRRLIAHRDPLSGKYATVTVYSEHEPIAPLAAPAAEFRPSQALAE